ncbi:MAG: pilin [Acidimicrobiales bacterium]
MPSPAHPHPAGTAPTPEPRPGAPTKEAATTHHKRTRPAPAERHGPEAACADGAHRHRHLKPPQHRRAAARRIAAGVALATALVVALASPAYAAGGGTQTLSGLISNLTTWIVGILAGVATLFLTIGGLRYLTAGGDPGQVEKAKTALKSAAIGYALAVLAPLIVSILASLVHG